LNYRRNRYRRAALGALNSLKDSNDSSAWRELPGLLKRTALAVYPRAELAASSGDDWLDFLQAHAGKSRLDPLTGVLLQRAAYEQEELSDEEISILYSSTQEWIKHHSAPA
jgi:hypothetical protein